MNIKSASKEALLITEALEALYHLLKYFISNITLEIREAHLRKKKLPQTMAAARGQEKKSKYNHGLDKLSNRIRGELMRRTKAGEMQIK